MQRLCDAHDMNNECDGSILTFNLFIVVTFVSSKSYAYIKFSSSDSAGYIKLMVNCNISI